MQHPKKRIVDQNFVRDENGMIAVIFALTLMPAVAMVGVAVDYGMAQSIKGQLQRAADGAAMAAAMSGPNTTEAERYDIAMAQFVANISSPGSPVGVTPMVQTGAGFVRIEAETNYTTKFMGLAGQPTIPVKVTSAVLTASKSAEIALMLDATGSMGGTKLTDMKWAAKDFLDIVMPVGGEGSASRVSLVPFNTRVNAGEYASTVTGFAPTHSTTNTTSAFSTSEFDWLERSPCGNRVREVHTSYSSNEARSHCQNNFQRQRINNKWHYRTPRVEQNTTTTVTRLITCVTERAGTFRGTDVAPSMSAFIGPNSPGGNTASQYNAAGDCKVGNRTLPAVIPLSTDRDAIRASIDAIPATSGTAGQLGTAWAWYTLSPNWNNIWPTESQTLEYNLNTNVKAAVLMTDGTYNTQSSGPGSASQALTLCNAMKAQGIIVYTVGFAMQNEPESSRQTLRDCASPGKYYFPYNGDELRQAFRSIGHAITQSQGSARFNH